MNTSWSLQHRLWLCFLFLFPETLHVPLINVVCLAAILKAIKAASQYSSFTLAVVQEDFIVKVPDKFTQRRCLLRVDILTPEDSIACCLPATHTIAPVLELTLYLPEQIILLNIQRTIDNRPCTDVNRL